MNLELICTRISSINNISTGKYLDTNCHGSEKVKRIKEKYNLSAFDEIFAYGDTKGDLPMLEIATRKFFKPFQ